MSDTTRAASDSPALGAVAQLVLDLSREPRLEAVLARFLETVRAWASPSAVLAAVEDPAEESGWRLLPSLSVGSGPLDSGRSVRQLVEDLPEGLARPCLVRPADAGVAVRPRENCVVPWAWEGSSGVLILRGVSEAGPDLAEAIALAAAPVWPRLLGGPAGRIETAVAQLRDLAERLRDDADRQIERLRLAGGERELATARAAEQAARETIEGLRRQVAEAEEQKERAGQEREELRRRASDLETALAQAEEAQHALGEARAAEQAARDATEGLRRQLAGTEERAARIGQEGDELRRRLADLEAALARAEDERRALGETRAAEQSARDVADGLRAQLKEAEEARETAAREREDLREAADGLRRQLADAEERAASAGIEREELRQQVRDLEEAVAKAEEERAEALAGRGAGVAPTVAPAPSDAGAATAALRRALGAARRTPFLPPPLRVATQDAEAVVGALEPRPRARARIALLDRDGASLEALADELEAGGFDVRIAGHPEELALMLRTPEGRELDAAICDVLAFRPDQTVAGIFRGWEKERPGLALFLSFSRDSPAEVERAQRVPLSLTRGRFQRPLTRPEVMELLEPILRARG